MASGISPELVAFVAAELGADPSRLTASTRLEHDLGVDGDDGAEFLLAFSRAYAIDISAVDVALYFGAEAGFNPLVALWWVVRRSWPRLVPIELQDLQVSISAGQWVPPKHPPV